MMHPCVSSGVQVWAVAGFTLLARHVGHTDAVGALALDGNFLFSGSEDATIRVWDTVPARVGSGEHFRSWIVCTLRFGGRKSFNPQHQRRGTVPGWKPGGLGSRGFVGVEDRSGLDGHV